MLFHVQRFFALDSAIWKYLHPEWILLNIGRSQSNKPSKDDSDKMTEMKFDAKTAWLV